MDAAKVNALYNELQEAIELCNDIAEKKIESNKDLFEALYSLSFACEDYIRAFDITCDDETE